MEDGAESPSSLDGHGGSVSRRGNKCPTNPQPVDNLIQEITKEFDITTIVVSHDMNSVMEIGEYVMFIFEGAKVWEGTNQDITKSDVKELNDFLFANALLRSVKDQKV